MGLLDMLDIGRLGMNAQRRALQTTQQNITNVNTPGYSRQRVNMSTIPPVNLHGVRKGGGGVEVDKVIRIHDGFVQKRIFEHSKFLGEHRMRTDTLRRIEDIVAGGSDNISTRINKFFNDLRELSLNPEVSTHRMAVQESARNMTHGFNSMMSQMEEMQEILDWRIDKTLGDVNSLAEELAHLNGLIGTYHARGGVPSELLDKQDGIVKDLSEKLGYQVERDELGQVNLIVPGSGVLVQGTEAASFVMRRSPGETPLHPATGKIYLKDFSTGRLIDANRFPSGELGGLTHVRDNVLHPTMRHLDGVAYVIADEINLIHREGTSASGATEQDFFKPSEYLEGAAGRMEISDRIDGSIDELAVGFSGDSPGDNRIALAMSQLQDERVLPELTHDGFGEEVRYSINETMNSLVTEVAIDAQTQERKLGHQEAIMEQLNNQRESLSGVSLEEEAINLMQYQTAFNAAAKTMKVGDELLQTILGIVD